MSAGPNYIDGETASGTHVLVTGDQGSFAVVIDGRPAPVRSSTRYRDGGTTIIVLDDDRTIRRNQDLFDKPERGKAFLDEEELT